MSVEAIATLIHPPLQVAIATTSIPINTSCKTSITSQNTTKNLTLPPRRNLQLDAWLTIHNG